MPEQDCLIEWLQTHAQCREIGEADLLAGHLDGALAALWQQAAPPTPVPSGSDEAAAALLPWLTLAEDCG
jgi:hypothetical protein